MQQSLATAPWRFRGIDPKSGRPSGWLPATVPGCVHTDLIAAGKIADPYYGTNELNLQWIEERDWEYATTFTVPAELLREPRVELVADGLDTVATVTVNGRRVATTENMFVAFRWDVKALLRPGRNVIAIRFRSAMDYVRKARSFTPPSEFNDPVGLCVRIRKQQCQFGWDWGPRFVTAGIWRDLRLEAGAKARLDRVHVQQHHAANGAVRLELTPHLSRRLPGATFQAELAHGGRTILSTTSCAFEVPSPQLWWPAGQGSQPLYELTVTARDASGRELGTIRKRLGLRTIALDQSPDQWGQAFRFVVNGRPVFIKGANWIPADCFVTRLDRERYSRDLRGAVAAHMNCVRVWGGGIYESEDFYDLCDELGLLVWQDFMFACTLYPSDRAFLRSVRAEAEHQVARLHHRASLAVWCGNNELVQLNGPALRTRPALRRGYESLFHQLLPAVVATHDGATSYHPTSEWRGTFENGHALGEKSGDTHYWDVWHARHPVKDYEKWAFRFCSEFGMQSYSSPQTNETFAPARANVFGSVMENHQKNRGGNQVILDYVSRRYRFPKSQDDLIYLSQLNQAYCMQVGVEHYRRTTPRCMGAIYWQLNDCWPVGSWSSIEYTGRWKLLHYAARRFNAPALASVHIPGDEIVAIGNYRRSTVREAHLYTVYDAPIPAPGRLRWEVFHLDGRRLLRGAQPVKLLPGRSVRQHTLDLEPLISTHGRDHICLRVALEVDGQAASEQTAFLTHPRFLELPKGTTKFTVRRLTDTEAVLRFTSSVFQHAFMFDFGSHGFTATDNGFDLYPGEVKQVGLKFTRAISAAALRSHLRHRSLVDTY